MKRIGKVTSLCLGLMLLCATLVWAAPSSLTQALRCYGTGEVCVYTLTWTGASSGGAFTSTALTAANVTTLNNHYLYMIDTDNGTIAPTAAYDITLTNARGYDILGGAGANRAQSANGPERVFCNLKSGTVGYPPVAGETLTLNISGNSVNSATGVIKLWFVK